MSYELSVVAPCYNEAGNLPELVSRLLAMFEAKNIDGQVVLVNDGSRDNTGQVIDELARHERVLAVHHPFNQGIAAGWASGVAAAGGQSVCFMDADLQNLPEDVSRLYRELELTNADLVQGYRSSIGRLKNSRYTLSKGLNWILNATFKMRLRDNKSGFVVGSRETMQDILRHRYHYAHFQTFIAISAAARGYTVREIETLFESRHVGESFIPQTPVRLIADVLLDVTKAVFEFRVNTKQENILHEYLEETPLPAREPETPDPLRSAAMSSFFWTMPAHKWMITRRAERYYGELVQSQWLAPRQVRELQERKLRRLVDHAYRHVPYYREVMDERGLKPSDVQTLEDLRKLPLLDKATVRERLYFDLLSDNHDKRKILRVHTSGSTGEPFVCFADQHQLEIRWAATLRSMEWTGYRFGDRQARLWHQTLGMSLDQRIRERIDALYNRRLFIPAFEMSDHNLGAVIERLRQHQPVLIDGYAESFNLLAHYIKHAEPGAVQGFDQLQGIMSSAQVLPDESRSIIEKAFGCRIFDKYGAREFSGIAYECDAHEGHHVVGESYIVEILCDGRPAKPGEMGEIIITDLNNLCMPFLRYRVGDLAVAMDDSVPCPCGRGLPRIGKIEGRVQALIFAKNGRFLPGTFFAHLFKDYDYLIRQYQVLQEQHGEITLKIVKAPRFNAAGFEGVLAELRKYLGADTGIDVQFVDHIPMVRTGKHQGSLSTVPIDFQSVGEPGDQGGRAPS